MNTKCNARMLAWLIAGGLTVGTFGTFATPVSAQETAAVAEARVPPAVVATARQNYLNSTDIDYRRSVEGPEVYQVNFTTPDRLRMQVRIDAAGQLVTGPVAAPNQPDNAPRGADRERAEAAWVDRVRGARPAVAAPMTTPAAVAPTVAPVPVPPSTPGSPAAPPAAPVNTEVRLADLPKPVQTSMERYTTGAKDVKYYRQTVEDRARYQAVYTVASGSRQEVTIHENGSLIDGPLTLVQNVDDKTLLADRPDAMQIATSVRTEPRDVPARAMDALSQYARAGTDVRYRRDTYPDGSVGYTAHWVQPNTDRRYWVTVGEDGTLRQAPKLSLFQPTGTPGQANSGVAVTWDSLPDAVKKTMEPLTRRDRQAKYYKQVNDNKISYGSIYADDGKQMWVRVDEAGQTIVNPVSAVTGRPVGNEPQPAASQVPANMQRDRVMFADMPKQVQAKVLKETEGAKDVVNMKHNQNGKAVFHTTWTDAKGQKQELWLDSAGEAVPVPKAGN